MLAQPENEDVRLFENQWIHPREREAEQRGKQEGRQEGRQEGMQQLLVRQLERRFGPVPDSVERYVRALESMDELTRLADQILTATSLDELGFP